MPLEDASPFRLAMNTTPVHGYPPWPRAVPDWVFNQPAVRDGTMDASQFRDFYRGLPPEKLNELWLQYQQRLQQQAPHMPPPPGVTK